MAGHVVRNVPRDRTRLERLVEVVFLRLASSDSKGSYIP